MRTAGEIMKMLLIFYYFRMAPFLFGTGVVRWRPQEKSFRGILFSNWVLDKKGTNRGIVGFMGLLVYLFVQTKFIQNTLKIN